MAILAQSKTLSSSTESVSSGISPTLKGTPDESWLPLVGLNGWVLLTGDKRIRYNFLEKRALKEHAVREFVFASGNMSGQEMASALELALPKMQRFCRKFRPPFVATIIRGGEVHLRWPKK